jgi:hypothetical protein
MESFQGRRNVRAKPGDAVPNGRPEQGDRCASALRNAWTAHGRRRARMQHAVVFHFARRFADVAYFGAARGVDVFDFIAPLSA